MISFVPARNYLFKVSNLSTRIGCESCSIIRMSMLMILNINDANGVIVYRNTWLGNIIIIFVI